MLVAIQTTLTEEIAANGKTSDKTVDKAAFRWNRIQEFLQIPRLYHERRCVGAVRRVTSDDKWDSCPMRD